MCTRWIWMAFLSRVPSADVTAEFRSVLCTGTLYYRTPRQKGLASLGQREIAPVKSNKTRQTRFANPFCRISIKTGGVATLLESIPTYGSVSRNPRKTSWKIYVFLFDPSNLLTRRFREAMHEFHYESTSHYQYL